jgi:hypothetical protein
MKTILFCATTPLSYAMFKPLHRRLKSDPRIDIWFTANHNARDLYRSVGLGDEKIINKYYSMFKSYDVCICPSFFYERKNAASKVQIFHGCSLKNRAVHKKALDYDKLFLIGPYMREKFMSTWNLPEDDPRFENVGMPKLDAFFDGSLDRERLMSRLSLDPQLPTVIYAPTRTSVTSSSLQMYGRDIIKTMGDMPVNFLIKLHDRSYRQWKSAMKEDWMSILSSYEGHPRIRPVFDYDVVPYLYVSDLLISDISSVVNEYSLLDRPMVLIHVPRLMSHHAKIERKRGVAQSDLEQWGQSAGLVVNDMAALQKTVERGLSRPEEKSDIRKEFAQRFFFNPGSAAPKAVAKIYSLLSLDPPS